VVRLTAGRPSYGDAGPAWLVGRAASRVATAFCSRGLLRDATLRRPPAVWVLCADSLPLTAYAHPAGARNGEFFRTRTPAGGLARLSQRLSDRRLPARLGGAGGALWLASAPAGAPAASRLRHAGAARCSGLALAPRSGGMWQQSSAAEFLDGTSPSGAHREVGAACSSCSRASAPGPLGGARTAVLSGARAVPFTVPAGGGRPS